MRSYGLKRRRKIFAIGGLYRQNRPPSIDHYSHVLHSYACFARRHVGEFRKRLQQKDTFSSAQRPTDKLACTQSLHVAI